VKEYTSIHEVTFEDLLEVLQAWENDELPYPEVQGWAEGITYFLGWYEYAKDDPRSILLYLIDALDHMYTSPILKKDIPTLRQIAQEAQISVTSASSMLDNFYASVDWAHRRSQASANMKKYGRQRLDEVTDP
jgi:hypothetical protein